MSISLQDNYGTVIINEVNSTKKKFQFQMKSKNQSEQKILNDELKKLKDKSIILNDKSIILNDKSIFDNGPRLAIIKPCLINEEKQSDIIQDELTVYSYGKDQQENIKRQQLNQENYNKDLSQSIIDVLSQLSDNQQKNKVIKKFLSISTTYQKYERMKFIEKYLSPQLIEYLKFGCTINIFKQLNDSYKMQLEQQIQNVLFFETSISETNNTIIYNSAFVASYLMCLFSSKVQQNSTKQRILFLNLTGIKNDDAELYKLFTKDECLYISLKTIPFIGTQQSNGILSLNDSNFKTILLLENQEELTWKQFRIIYKYQIKKYIKNFKSNIFILSIAKQFNCNESQQGQIKYSEDCIKNIIEKFSHLAKDKLIIHSFISHSQTKQQNQELQKQQLLSYINSLQQGILSREILLTNGKDEMLQRMEEIKYDDWIKNLFQKNRREMTIEQQELIQREIRNQMLNSKVQLVQDTTIFKLGVYIIKDQDENEDNKRNFQIFYLLYDKNYLQFLTDTILYVDYIGQLIVLLQYENKQYFVYYQKYEIFNTDEQDGKDIQCERINLSEKLLEQNIELNESIILNSSLIVSDKTIYIIYFNDASQILMINLQSSSVVVLKRTTLKFPNEEDTKLKKFYNQNQNQVQQQIQDRRKPTIVLHPCLTEFNFIIFGGEFVNSNQICNLIELIKFEKKDFTSMIIPKEILFQKCNYYIPWPNMIVLINNQIPYQYILLPGDYNNKTFYYNQVINKEHQEKAILITSDKNSLQFRFDYLKIVYINKQTPKKILPIQYFSGNQINVKNPKQYKEFKYIWYLAITMLEQQSQDQNSFSKLIQLFIEAEIEIKIQGGEKELRIIQSFNQHECGKDLNKQIINCQLSNQIETKSDNSKFQQEKTN